MKRTFFALISLLVLASMLLTACGGGGGGTTTELRSVTIAMSQEPDLVVPLFSSMSYAAWVGQMVLVGLGKWDANNNLIPELATEIPSGDNGGISADGLTITWHLKPDLLWSDGEALTSADVKFTWEVLVDPGNAVYSRAGYDKISSIDTPDATTVVLHFSELFPDWQVLFSAGPNNQGNILPQHILTGKTGLESDPFIHWPTVSSGPWIITDWVAGDHMTFAPNPNYYQGLPKLDQIQIKFVPDPETQLAALKTGDVDVGLDFAESDLTTLAALEPGIHTKVDSGPEFEHYFFNLGTAAGVTLPDGTITGKSDQDGSCPFTDLRVRKAIMLGIDRFTMVQTLLEGKTTVPASLWPNSYWTNTSLVPYPYDPTQAMALLDEAGYTDTNGDGIREGLCNGVETKLSFNFETTDKQLRMDMAVATKDMLAQIGVEFKPIHTPAGTFFGDYASGANMYTGRYDMAGYTTGFYPAPYTDQFLCKNVTSADNQGGSNTYHMCYPELDNLFALANSSADPAVRKPYFDQIQQYQYDNVLFVPMYVRANVNAYLDRVVIGETSVISGILWNTFNWDLK